MPVPERKPALLSKAPTKSHPLAPSIVPEVRPESETVEVTDPPVPVTEEPVTRDEGGVDNKAGGERGRAGERITATLSARVPVELRDAVKIHAAQHRTSVQDIVTEAVEAYLKR